MAGNGRRRANQHRKLARNNWAEQDPKETSRKTALQGNEPHLSWVPASHKSKKEGDSSQKEIAIHLHAGNMKEKGKGKAALSQRPATLFRKRISGF